jgi:hypothetical protein
MSSFFQIGASAVKAAATGATEMQSILNKVKNPDTFLATFASNDAASKTKYIDDLAKLSNAGASISSLIPGIPQIPVINDTTKAHLNALVDDDEFKGIIQEINTDIDLKKKVVSKLSDGNYTVTFAGGLMENLKAGNTNDVTQIIKGEFEKIKAEPEASASALSSSNPIGSVSASHEPPSGTATLTQTRLSGGLPLAADTTTVTTKDENCGEMRRMFRELIEDTINDTASKQNEMLVALINKMIVRNNSKIVRHIANSFPTSNASFKIRFSKKSYYFRTGGARSARVCLGAQALIGH